ncbi:MAG: ATP-binding protein [Campylobacterota bacterium]|nr:ATP-binding protein [Campylobacterota bacterium]
MQPKLKDRLKLVTLFPIIILFILTSYYLYNSYNLENNLNLSIIAIIVLLITILFAILNLKLSSEVSNTIQTLEDAVEENEKDKLLAQEASEAKSMFLANMSHEIRTPLNGIVGFTELLKDTGLDEEQVEFVEIIEKSSENLLEIINNILDLSKIESNKVEIEHIKFNPIEEFENAVEVYAVRASEKHIDLSCFIDPMLDNPIKGDPTKIKEIIINLLSNAVKFTSSSGNINVDIRKVDSENKDTTKIKFEVQDNGIGITPKQKEKIFEAFGQANTSITRKYGGTGLGLTISSSFVELMGGELNLHSEPEKGTSFFFTLEFENDEMINKSLKGSFSTINALILEDNHKNKKQELYLHEYLKYYGVNFNTFKNIDELNILEEKNSYDLLFIDYGYTKDNYLVKFAELPQALILLSKSNYMKTIESLNLNTFKTIYEPLNMSKIKQVLSNYNSENYNAKKDSKTINKEVKFNANILVAEDNIINQKLIKRTLEDIGLSVTIASNGLEAFQKRKDGNFDLIFMDIQMPILDGVEATKEILEYEEDYNQTHVPIIALTANALKGDKERFIDAGLDEYATKPLVRSNIISHLNHFISDSIIDGEYVKRNLKALQELSNEEKIVEETIKKNYKADILLVKNSSFEAKLYQQILKTLTYTYEILNKDDSLYEKIQNRSYKLILFDKNYDDVILEEFSKKVKELNRKNSLDTYLVMIDDSSSNEENITYIDEVVPKVVNKDLLHSVFEKYLKVNNV